MKTDIVQKPAFSVIGLEDRGPHDEASQWIMPLWQRVVTRRSEIASLITEHGWGLMSGTESFLSAWAGGTGRYLAGWELKPGTEPPDGWTVWEVPETTFATVPCKLASYAEVWQFIEKEFLPSSGYELAGAVHEYYPPEFRDIHTDSFRLHVTIAKKS